MPDSTFTDRSPIVIYLWSRVVYSAGLFKDVTSIIYGQDRYSQARIENLIRSGLRTRESIIRWRCDFDNMPEATTQDQYNRRYQILGVCLSYLALLNRLIGAIDPSRRTDFEDESQALAREVARMENEASFKSPVAGFFLSQKMSIARSILDSARIWKDDIQDEPKESHLKVNLIEKWRFENWCMILGRTYIPAPHIVEYLGDAQTIPAIPMGPPTKSRKRKAPTLHADAWEPYKARIVELHIEQGLPLWEVKNIMNKFGLTAEYVSLFKVEQGRLLIC